MRLNGKKTELILERGTGQGDRRYSLCGRNVLQAKSGQGFKEEIGTIVSNDAEKLIKIRTARWWLC